MEAEQTCSPTSVHVQNKRAVTYAPAHSDVDTDTDVFSGVNRDDSPAAAFVRARVNLRPDDVDPHRRTDEQLARMGDLRFTISSSDAGFYIGHFRLHANTMASIMLQLSGFVIILDSLAERTNGA